jgi:hypothetical protein
MENANLLRDRLALAIVGGGAIVFGLVGIICNLVWCFALGMLFWHFFKEQKADLDEVIAKIP